MSQDMMNPARNQDASVPEGPVPASLPCGRSLVTTFQDAMYSAPGAPLVPLWIAIDLQGQSSPIEEEEEEEERSMTALHPHVCPQSGIFPRFRESSPAPMVPAGRWLDVPIQQPQFD
ncbi:hypothetical protein ColLi_08457 [Colletotrichum liriopes]|uniref:Uncharacterized protein n=1 Tax=Colletotrichum liriopes TaxID=708192 RepID=A0AA37GQZ3_9PEZI|nr:hypothetical protein ColLi_08457 [Colletotrichum liriopes]